MMKNKHEKVEPQKITPNYVTPIGMAQIWIVQVEGVGLLYLDQTDRQVGGKRVRG